MNLTWAVIPCRLFRLHNNKAVCNRDSSILTAWTREKDYSTLTVQKKLYWYIDTNCTNNDWTIFASSYLEECRQATAVRCSSQTTQAHSVLRRRSTSSLRLSLLWCCCCCRCGEFSKLCSAHAEKAIATQTAAPAPPIHRLVMHVSFNLLIVRYSTAVTEANGAIFSNFQIAEWLSVEHRFMLLVWPQQRIISDVVWDRRS